MKSRIIAGTIAVLALGTAGIAVAEGTAGQKKDQPAHEAAQQGQSSQMKTGINRLDSVKLSVLDEESATNLQTKLQELGYYKAEVDGKIGTKTRAALAQFFRDQAQLVNRGRLSELAMTSLGFDDSEIERVRGLEEEPTEEQRAPTRGVEEDESPSGTGTGTRGSQGTLPDVER